MGRRRAHGGGSEPPQIGREVLKSEPVWQIKLQAATDTVSGDGFSKSSGRGLSHCLVCPLRVMDTHKLLCRADCWHGGVSKSHSQD